VQARFLRPRRASSAPCARTLFVRAGGAHGEAVARGARTLAMWYNEDVDSLPAPESSDLVSELTALLRAGYAVTLIPRFTPYGVVYADVRIVRLKNPHMLLLPTSPTLSSQVAPATFPVRRKFHIFYEMNSLAAWLRRVRLLLCASG